MFNPFTTSNCRYCHGKGLIEQHLCLHCDGTGTRPRVHIVIEGLLVGMSGGLFVVIVYMIVTGAKL